MPGPYIHYCPSSLNHFGAPIFTAGVWIGLTQLYAILTDRDLPMNVVLVNAGVLGLSSYATQVSHQDNNPAMKAISTGTLYSGIMYGAFANEQVVRDAMIGTACSYTAELLTGLTSTYTASPPHDKDGKQGIGYSTAHPQQLFPKDTLGYQVAQ